MNYHAFKDRCGSIFVKMAGINLVGRCVCFTLSSVPAFSLRLERENLSEHLLPALATRPICCRLFIPYSH